MTGTTPATSPTDRASSSQHTHRVTRRTPSSNGMGRPTRLVATVLLLCGVLFCGSSATIPQPPPVTTRQESVLRPTATLSSHNNNVVADADDADGTTIPPPPPSPSPSSVKAHSDTKALLHQVTLLSECHGHDGDCTTMSLFSSLLALTIPILKHGGVILREVVSGSTTLSFDNGSVVAVTDDAVDAFVTVVLDTDDDAAVTVIHLPPPLVTKAATATATATVEHTEDTTLSSKNESVAADTDDDAAVPVVLVAMILLFVIAFVIVMVYTMVQYLWAQRPGQQDDMPPRRAIIERPTGQGLPIEAHPRPPQRGDQRGRIENANQLWEGAQRPQSFLIRRRNFEANRGARFRRGRGGQRGRNENANRLWEAEYPGRGD